MIVLVLRPSVLTRLVCALIGAFSMLVLVVAPVAALTGDLDVGIGIVVIFLPAFLGATTVALAAVRSDAEGNLLVANWLRARRIAGDEVVAVESGRGLLPGTRAVRIALDDERWVKLLATSRVLGARARVDRQRDQLRKRYPALR
jgi:hypothetical protein